jgi:hypothetical protein
MAAVETTASTENLTKTQFMAAAVKTPLVAAIKTTCSTEEVATTHFLATMETTTF